MCLLLPHQLYQRKHYSAKVEDLLEDPEIAAVTTPSSKQEINHIGQNEMAADEKGV